MADPRNVAHAKKVTQEKKHHGTAASLEGAPAVQPGRKPSVAMKKKKDLAGPSAVIHDTAAGEIAVPGESSTVKPTAAWKARASCSRSQRLEFHRARVSSACRAGADGRGRV